jgi:hypothetical protein
MGVTALAVTGGTFFNYLSNTDGSVALYNEGESLVEFVVTRRLHLGSAPG